MRVILPLFWAAASAGTAIAAAVIAFGLVFQGNIWHFPGDPPYIDYALVPASVAFVMCVAFIVGRRLTGRGTQKLNTHARAICVCTALVFCLCIAGIAFRFSPAWREIREGLHHHGERVARAAGGPRVLTREEFAVLRNEYMPVPLDMQLGGYGNVSLHMMDRAYPYACVDFGRGQNACFDLRTMLVTYSD